MKYITLALLLTLAACQGGGVPYSVRSDHDGSKNRVWHDDIKASCPDCGHPGHPRPLN